MTNKIEIIFQLLSNAPSGLKSLWKQSSNSPSFKGERSLGLIALNGVVIGILFGLGIGLLFFSNRFFDLGIFLIFLSNFHFIEFLFAATYHPNTVSVDSFMFNHSTSFSIAMSAAFIEYFIESYFQFFWKQSFLMWIGIILCFLGQIVRLTAFYTAKQSFTHIVASTKKKEHELVTNGIYQLSRHPSYFGWFWWAVGTQMILSNPICIIGYAAASIAFFKDRIEDEEQGLVKFFGKDYENFRKQVKFIGIPFVG
eukprot:TRINITY_DN6509_c3_g1_i1.p1 TRINITY_DN6509_c3_g1~~TRINITY_DN6509_c3_g1_i1.p1  ORF type:complete len:254 (-),score=94.22 TRINITY_DN6509_c3_g1_i1:111-872(-)